MTLRNYLNTISLFLLFFCLIPVATRGAVVQTKNTEGPGRIVLCDDKDFESQIVQTNTIYEIRNNFTLKKDIKIPEGCILDFNGGSLSGAYTITGSNTNIRAGIFKIFNTDIKLAQYLRQLCPY